MAKADIAFFDFDGTISRSDSFALFLKFILGQKFYVKLLQHLPLLICYKMGLLTNSKTKESILKSCLGGMRVDDFTKYCDDFLLTLESICKDSALDRIKWHKDRGDKVVIVSASFEEYLGLLARKLDIEVIATKMEVCDTKLTGRFSTPNCYGVQKVVRIKEQFNLESFGEIYAYGDTEGDREMLALADKPFYRIFN